MAEPARPFWEADEVVAAAPLRESKEKRPFWEQDEIVATKAEAKKAAPGILESIGRGGLQGVTYGIGDEAYAAGVAAAAKAKGKDFGPEYERQLAETQAANRAAKEANPWSYGIAEVVGSIPPLIAGGATALGARALGLTGRSMLQRSGAAAASGAALGAFQGGATADPGERVEGAAIGAGAGGVLGAASPALGAAIGKGAGWVSDAVRARMAPNPSGMSNAAADLLTQDMKSAGGAGAVRSRLDELGPEARLLDASPSFQGRAQGLAIQPETREMIVDPLVARNSGTNARLATDLDSAIGPAPVPSRVEAGIAAARDATAEGYGPVLGNASAVDTRAVADALETQAVQLRGPAQRAVRQVRSMLDVDGVPGTLDPNPATLLSTRQAIDGLLDGEANSQVVRALTAARRQVDDALAAAAPGVKQVDAPMEELFRQSEGLQRGSQIFDSGKNAIRPADFEDQFVRAAEPKGVSVGPSAEPLRIKQGARAEIDRLVGTEANDLNALRKAIKGEGDWNYTKLVRAFGSREAARVWNAVDREAAFREAYQNIVGGSQTALRAGAAEGTKVRGQGGSTASAGLPAIAGAVGGPQAAALAMGAQGAKMGANQVMKAADLARNRQVAQGLMTQVGPELDAMIDGLAARILAQSRSQITAEQARDVAQIFILSQGENAGQGAKAGVEWATK